MSRAFRVAVAGPASVALNLLLVFGLSRFSPQNAEAREPAVEMPINVIDTTPQDAEARPKEAETTRSVAPTALPAIDVPPLNFSKTALALPELVADLAGLDLTMPAYVASGGAVVGELDQGPGPQLLSPPDLQRFYPSRAARMGLEGRTVLEVQVRADGTVQSVQILNSSPRGVFERAARRAAQQLRYTTAGRSQTANSVSRLEFEWKLRDR